MLRTLIENNLIHCPIDKRYIKHTQNILCGKPKGTYFFYVNVHGEMMLAVNAGGFEVYPVEIETSENEIIVGKYSGKRNFHSEEEFFNYAKNEGILFPGYPYEPIKLTYAISELKHVVMSLQYLTAFSICSNPDLIKKVWESEEQQVSEDLEDYLYDIEDQLKAGKVASKF